jgi:hypothetical protein
MARGAEAMRAELLALGLATDDELRRLKVTVHPLSATVHPPSATVHPPSATVHPPSATVHPLRPRRPKDAAVEAKLLEAYVAEAAGAEAAGAPGPGATPSSHTAAGCRVWGLLRANLAGTAFVSGRK